MKKVVLMFAPFVVLSGCGSSDVYGEPIPSPDDHDALIEIRDGVKPEDREAWSKLTMRIVNPMAVKIDAETVGEAITRLKAREACLADSEAEREKLGPMPTDIMAPDYDERNKAYIEGYNATVESNNACLKLPV